MDLKPYQTILKQVSGIWFGFVCIYPSSNFILLWSAAP